VSPTQVVATSNVALVTPPVAPEVTTALAESQPSATQTAALRASNGARHAAASSSVLPPKPDAAAWLFRAASRARADGHYQEAAALYGVLQRDYAGSETEVVARVALGRLWLSHLDDARSALQAFDSYLSARPHGSLAEEARSGRVIALRKLGRDTEANAALQDLLQHHPASLYAKTLTASP
jgi:TolA-binding protein